MTKRRIRAHARELSAWASVPPRLRDRRRRGTAYRRLVVHLGYPVADVGGMAAMLLPVGNGEWGALMARSGGCP